MSSSRSLAVFLLLLSGLAASAKDKKKTPLPADILQARTVLVVIDPDAGMAIDDPNANRIARDDVEKAVMKWGRFQLAQEASTADLIMVVRRGNGKIAQNTIGGLPTNGRSVILQPTDSGARIGGRQGNSGNAGDPSNTEPSQPHPQTEIGDAQDMFVVYRGNKDEPHWATLDSPPVWRYSAKDALADPDVPAVEIFRKLVAETEKKLATP
jgi:hypothetical protein